MFDCFKKNFFNTKKDADAEVQGQKEFVNVFSPKNIKDSILINKDNHVGDNIYHINVVMTESTEKHDESEIAMKVKPLEQLLEKHQYWSAIEAYKGLLEDYATKSLSPNDLFYIFNGILNCYVNLNDKANVQRYIDRIEKLGQVNEIHKFHYLCAVYYLNQRQHDKSVAEIRKVLEYKPDYFKAIYLRVLIEFENGIIDIESAIRQLIDDEDNPIIGKDDNKDKASVYNTLGDIYFSAREFSMAIKYYEKANSLVPSHFEKMHIGVTLFFDSIKSGKVGEIIDPKDVDFKRLREANSVLGELYNIDDEEVRRVIRKSISSFYIKSLYILRDTTKINLIFPEIKEYCTEEKEEIYRLKAVSEIMHGDISKVVYDELSDEDKEWFRILKLTEEKRFAQVIAEIEPFIWGKYSNIEKYHHILLESYLRLATDESYEKFEKHVKQLSDINQETDFVKFLKGIYYEAKGNIQKAESIIKAVAVETSDFHFYFELMTFYERNRLEVELGELFDDLLINKTNIIEAEKNGFYRKYFLYMFRNNFLEKAIEAYESINAEDLNAVTYSYITAELLYLVGDLKASAIEFEKHYDLSKNMESLFRSLQQYLACNNIDKAEELLNFLLLNSYPKKAILYCIYSNIEILKNNTDKSYEYMKKALELDKDNPNSDVHQYYVSRSIRCAKEEGFSHVAEYVANYPRHDKWVRSVKALEEDEAGNEVLTQEIKDFLFSASKRFNMILNNYRNREMGLSILAKVENQTIPQILDWRHIYKLKAYVYQGVIEEVYSEMSVFSDRIIMDSLSLYILSEIGYLDTLRKLETVYITYSTIESLQNDLLVKEDSRVREILRFINQSINIKIVYPDFKDISKVDESFLKLFFKDQLDSSIYSYSNGIPYLYSDYFIKKGMEGKTEYFIGLVAFFRALVGQALIDREQLSDVIFNLKKNKYDFINFDSDDVYNIAKKSDFIVNDDIKLFFEIDKYCDMPSFAIVYVNFFRRIYNQIERHKFDAYVDLFIETFDRYVRKTQYYFHILEDIFPDLVQEIGKLGHKNSLSSILLFEELGADKIGESFMENITNTFEYNRIKKILLGSEGALRLFLYMFKNDDEEYEYYSQKIRTQCCKLLPSEVELLITQTKKFDYSKFLEKIDDK